LTPVASVSRWSGFEALVFSVQREILLVKISALRAQCHRLSLEVNPTMIVTEWVGTVKWRIN